MDVDGHTVHIRELTIGEIGEWLNKRLQSEPQAEADPLPQLIRFGGVTLADLLWMTDLTMDKVNTLTGSQLEEVSKGCKAVNQSFFDLADQVSIGEQIVRNQLTGELSKLLNTSTETAQH